MSIKNMFRQYHGMRTKYILLLQLFLYTSAVPHKISPDSGHCYTIDWMTLIMLACWDQRLSRIILDLGPSPTCPFSIWPNFGCCHYSAPTEPEEGFVQSPKHPKASGHKSPRLLLAMCTKPLSITQPKRAYLASLLTPE